MKLATILLIPEEIEGSEFEKYLNEQPSVKADTYPCHDGINAAFPFILKDAINPIIVNDMTDSEGLKLEGDALLSAVAQVLFAEDRTRPIQIGYGDLQALYEHATYQLYAPTCETLEELQAIYKSVFVVDLVAVDFEAGKVKARVDLKAYFLG